MSTTTSATSSRLATTRSATRAGRASRRRQRTASAREVRDSRRASVDESERRRGDRRRSLTTGAVTNLTAAIAELLKQVSDRSAASELTADVEQAARLLKTTRGGIYAMHARGQLPKPIGPGGSFPMGVSRGGYPRTAAGRYAPPRAGEVPRAVQVRREALGRGARAVPRHQRRDAEEGGADAGGLREAVHLGSHRGEPAQAEHGRELPSRGSRSTSSPRSGGSGSTKSTSKPNSGSRPPCRSSMRRRSTTRSASSPACSPAPQNGASSTRRLGSRSSKHSSRRSSSSTSRTSSCS